MDVPAVWEWLDDYGFWNEFYPDAAVLLEDCWLQGNLHVPLYLLPLDDASHDMFYDSQEGWMEDPDNRSVLKQLRRVQPDPSTAPLWRYWDAATSVWKALDVAASASIEQGYVNVTQTAAQNRSVGQGSFQVTVDGKATHVIFATEGWQVNRQTQKRRGVRRRWPVVPVVRLANADAPPTLGVNLAQVAASLSNANPPNNGGSGAAPLATGGNEIPALQYDSAKAFVPAETTEVPEGKECAVCCDVLVETNNGNNSNSFMSNGSGCSSSSSTSSGSEVIKLANCLHTFHRQCIEEWFRRRVSCPECLKHYGTIFGTQPVMGARMTVDVHPCDEAWNIEGFPETGVIEMTFIFDDGIQGPEHPNPGMAYTGTARTAYLPDNGPGREILELFKVAWERRLLFCVGRSVTRGVDNTVCWFGIHMKTSLRGGPAQFGYPDETYFARVKGELHDQGVY